MDIREARRQAAREMARLAEVIAHDLRTSSASRLAADLHRKDRARLRAAFLRLAAELAERGKGPAPQAIPVDPNQMILTECCDGTGYADHVSVPCVAPDCPALRTVDP